MTARAAWVAAATAARVTLAERGALAVSLGFYVIVVMAVSSLWRVAAAANGGEVAGYPTDELVWYLAASEAAIIGVRLRLIEVVADGIADGSVATEMLRPASVVGMRLAGEVGRVLPRASLLGATGAVAAAAMTGGVPDARALPVAAVALLLATTANEAAQHAVGALAFWLRDVRGVWILYQKVVFIVGGMLMPLEALPAGLGAVARALPFMAMAYAPARLASGHLEPGLVAAQVAWVAVLVAVAALAFAAGERRLQAVGG